ncbi:SPOCS domain-containing protein [Sporohalobacter salinus]|uniref:SPOCS domain-containing protein n=1 Tax=Sporohalobacter salinus TaxID=1494606 RepID=UPI0019614757|nr:SPOCS domain-containing protein [Sporohalobacter salinus]MBM7624224.1 hypothetical protein [Sporohalobacter salinus]
MGNCNLYKSDYELITMDQDIKCTSRHVKCKEFIKEKMLCIPETNPDIEQLTKVIIKPKIISYEIICTPEGPKLIIKGKIIEKIFYIDDTAGQCIHCATFKFPFHNFIKLKDYVCIKDIKIKLEDVFIQLCNKRKLEQSILILVCIVPKKDCCNCKPKYDYKSRCNCKKDWNHNPKCDCKM